MALTLSRDVQGFRYAFLTWGDFPPYWGISPHIGRGTSYGDEVLIGGGD